MPHFWPVERKTKKFVVGTVPGPHSKARSISLGVVLRDTLKLAEDMSEAKRILNNGVVKIDGKVRKERRFSVGLMDIVTAGDEHYRILPGKKGLCMHKISGDECKIKLSKIRNKSCVSGRVQLNLYDGKNIIVSSDKYRTGDVLVIDVGSNEIKHVLNFRKGSVAIITGGSNAGSVGKIEDIVITRSPQPNQVAMLVGARTITVPADYVYVIGSEKPVISLPKVDSNE